MFSIKIKFIEVLAFFFKQFLYTYNQLFMAEIVARSSQSIL
ncbi:hypothetical protein SAMN04487894_111115 [Niabella drilacis]|uniref:Uncharacterized protein n=1 Tax=Niabella drilacis (strain DSM 25811 / CCM 8410 / CCUG 62505 / LMG 26954 / E90) TaxID=1285928 RepID=A0A1G6WG02_NIADE|nr:hypothetical protein SAMN04487894_111115 [Niabella drilacis]